MQKTVKQSVKKAVRYRTDADFDSLVKAFKRNRHVTYGGKGFGSTALKVNGKIFAMLSSNGQFVIKLPKERVEELVQAGKGRYFEPKPGRLMKEWLAVKLPKSHWLKLAQKACEFVQHSALPVSQSR